MKFIKMMTLALLLALISSAVPAVFTHAAPADRAVLKGSAPPWANSNNLTGSADPADSVGFRVYLGWNNADAAAALAQAVSDPNSSSYGKYLTPAQFRKQFAPSQAQVNAVQSWLKSQGFTIDYTPTNNHYVAAEGTVAHVEAAFGAQLGMYAVNGQSVRSPMRDVSIPTSLSAIVNGVIGLDDSAIFVHTDHVADKNAPPSAGFRNAPPLSAYWAELPSPYPFSAGFTDVPLPTAPWSIKGHTPDQIKGAYGISGYDGAGQTVAIIDAYASPTIVDDVNEWSRRRGLSTMNASQLVQHEDPARLSLDDRIASGICDPNIGAIKCYAQWS